jgi:hypothetical protein
MISEVNFFFSFYFIQFFWCYFNFLFFLTFSFSFLSSFFYSICIALYFGVLPSSRINDKCLTSWIHHVGGWSEFPIVKIFLYLFFFFHLFFSFIVFLFFLMPRCRIPFYRIRLTYVLSGKVVWLFRERFPLFISRLYICFSFFEGILCLPFRVVRLWLVCWTCVRVNTQTHAHTRCILLWGMSWCRTRSWISPVMRRCTWEYVVIDLLFHCLLCFILFISYPHLFICIC